MAITGQGFFRVKVRGSGGNAVGYTRNGSFFRNAKGQLTLGIGYDHTLALPIAIPPPQQDIRIAGWNNRPASLGASRENRFVGRMQLFKFANPTGLKPLGDTIYSETDASGAAVESKPGESAGSLLQGMLEDLSIEQSKH